MVGGITQGPLDRGLGEGHASGEEVGEGLVGAEVFICDVVAAVVVGMPCRFLIEIFSGEAALCHDASELGADVVLGTKGGDLRLWVEHADGELQDVEEIVLMKVFDEVEIRSGDSEVADFALLAGLLKDFECFGEVGGIRRAVVEEDVDAIGSEALE